MKSYQEIMDPLVISGLTLGPEDLKTDFIYKKINIICIS